METPVVFECAGDRLVGILHEGRGGSSGLGVVVVVGGPQYRVGSHRQFVLLARYLAAAGAHVLRFDYRSMGDSEGATRSYENVAADIRSAVDLLLERVPSVRHVALVGLCDAATASLVYAPSDARVGGVVAINPWARSATGEARAYVKHYYLQRVLSRSFWKKLFGGGVQIGASLRQFIGHLMQSREPTATVDGEAESSDGSSIERMFRALREPSAPVLILISENDLTAQEFMDKYERPPEPPPSAGGAFTTVARLPGADHTFSRKRDLEYANETIRKWFEERLTGP